MLFIALASLIHTWDYLSQRSMWSTLVNYSTYNIRTFKSQKGSSEALNFLVITCTCTFVPHRVCQPQNSKLLLGLWLHVYSVVISPLSNSYSPPPQTPSMLCSTCIHPIAILAISVVALSHIYIAIWFTTTVMWICIIGLLLLVSTYYMINHALITRALYGTYPMRCICYNPLRDESCTHCITTQQCTSMHISVDNLHRLVVCMSRKHTYDWA